MKNLYVVTGIPGVGKSTFINKHFNDVAVKVVSRDAIRFSIVKEDEAYFSHETKVFNTFISEIKEGIENPIYESVVVDATHLNESSRAKLFRALGNSIANVNSLISLYFDVDVNTAINQNENRKDTRSYVPVSAIRRMSSQLTKPTFEEGFDRIYTINPNKKPSIVISVKEN